jgi:hypothetical protein
MSRKAWIGRGCSNSMRSDWFPDYRIAPMIVGGIILVANLNCFASIKHPVIAHGCVTFLAAAMYLFVSPTAFVSVMSHVFRLD